MKLGSTTFSILSKNIPCWILMKSLFDKPHKKCYWNVTLGQICNTKSFGMEDVILKIFLNYLVTPHWQY